MKVEKTPSLYSVLAFDVFSGSCLQSTVHDLTVHRATPEDIVSAIAVAAAKGFSWLSDISVYHTSGDIFFLFKLWKIPSP